MASASSPPSQSACPEEVFKNVDDCPLNLRFLSDTVCPGRTVLRFNRGCREGNTGQSDKTSIFNVHSSIFPPVSCSDPKSDRRERACSKMAPFPLLQSRFLLLVLATCVTLLPASLARSVRSGIGRGGAGQVRGLGVVSVDLGGTGAGTDGEWHDEDVVQPRPR